MTTTTTTAPSAPTYKLQLTLDVPQEFLNCLITTACEGGINYWAACTDYKWSHGQDTDGDELTGPTTVTVQESVDDLDYDGETIMGRRGGEYKAVGVDVGPQQMLDAIIRILDVAQPLEFISDNFRNALLDAVRQPNGEGDGDLDANDCDLIMQVAVLGRIVYG